MNRSKAYNNQKIMPMELNDQWLNKPNKINGQLYVNYQIYVETTTVIYIHIIICLFEIVMMLIWKFLIHPSYIINNGYKTNLGSAFKMKPKRVDGILQIDQLGFTNRKKLQSSIFYIVKIPQLYIGTKMKLNKNKNWVYLRSQKRLIKINLEWNLISNVLFCPLCLHLSATEVSAPRNQLAIIIGDWLREVWYRPTYVLLTTPTSALWCYISFCVTVPWQIPSLCSITASRPVDFSWGSHCCRSRLRRAITSASLSSSYFSFFLSSSLSSTPGTPQCPPSKAFCIFPCIVHKTGVKSDW